MDTQLQLGTAPVLEQINYSRKNALYRIQQMNYKKSLQR